MPISLKFPKRIANLIPQNEVTLFTGLPGTGKSYSLLKFLNSNNVKPILFNLDHDATLSKFMLTGEIIDEDVLVNFIEKKYTDLADEVIVIDTYQRTKEILDLNEVDIQEKFTNRINDIARNFKCTVIIVGHPHDFVGSSSIFKDNPSLVRNAYEHLHLDKVVDKRKKPPEINYRLYVNKGRGVGGSIIIDNWMR